MRRDAPPERSRPTRLGLISVRCVSLTTCLVTVTATRHAYLHSQHTYSRRAHPYISFRQASRASPVSTRSLLQLAVNTAPAHVFAEAIGHGAQYRNADIDPVIVQPLACAKLFTRRVLEMTSRLQISHRPTQECARPPTLPGAHGS